MLSAKKRDERRDGEIYHGFLRFHRLRGDPGRNLHYLVALALRIRGRPNEPWTARILDFKDGNPRAIEGACRLFRKHFSKLPYPDSTVLCCALGASRTTLLPGEPLRELGSAVAESRGWRFMPELLCKKEHRSLNHFKLGLVERVAEVSGLYTASTITLSCEHVIVLDDYCSSGVTLSEIARAIREANPEVVVSGLVLGRSRKTKSRYNGHLSGAYSKLWKSPVSRTRYRKFRDRLRSWLKRFQDLAPQPRKKKKRS